MSREELLSGLRWLCNKLYDPAAFGERVVKQIDLLAERPADDQRTHRRTHEQRPTSDTLKLLRSLSQLGEAEAEMWTRIRRRLAARPDLTSHVIPVVLQYLQVRYMYDHAGLWDARAHEESPRRPAPLGSFG
jgi:hypothetical protein